MPVKTRKKLIEVALPLEAINKASAREKSIRHGHPSTLHLWWARRPLAAARAVIFAQMVDDPSEYVEALRSDAKLRRRAEAILRERKKKWAEARKYAERMGDDASHPGPGPEPTLDDILAERERERLFQIIEDLVRWENTTNEEVLNQARDEIWQSWRRACAGARRRREELGLSAEDLERRFDPDRLPAFHDPFAGGGALPLEAQRLGLEAWASDLNPVAVLINKAMIEIPPKFAGRPPVNPQSHGLTEVNKGNKGGKTPSLPSLSSVEWRGAQGLAEDVRYYGKWMRDEAEKRIGRLYPKFKVTPELAKERKDLEKYVGRELTVIAWLWARTVKSPNPAFRDVEVPLASTFLLSTKKGKEAWVEVVTTNERAGGEATANQRESTRMEKEQAGKGNKNLRPSASIRGSASAASMRGYEFVVKTRASHGAPPAEAKAGTTAGKRHAFKCALSGVPIPYDYIRAEGKAGRMGARLMAIVAQGDRGRVYLPPTPEHEAAALKAKPKWKPEMPLPDNPRDFKTPNYGLTTYGDLFTPRQLVALTTFSDLVGEAMERILDDARTALSAVPGTAQAGRLPDDDKPLRDGGTGAKAYAEAVAVYLGIAVDYAANYWSVIATPADGFIRGTFARQALPMTWDYAEAPPLGSTSGNWMGGIEWATKALDAFPTAAMGTGTQADAAAQSTSSAKVISTDPPYYDNIGYADLSDFFYVWLRRSLRIVFPDLFATLAVPKAEELVATPYRHGNKEKAESFFLEGMTRAMHRLAEQAHPAFPVTIYYAFKQAETKNEDDTASTGWETFLEAVIRAGFGISGTWPMRTERGARSTGIGTNALASSIVLVCRKRPADLPAAPGRAAQAGAPTATRREFVAALQRELPAALRRMQAGNIAPVDLAQAAIGPGMAVFTRYARVLDAEGNSLSVRQALALINQTLDEALAEQEGEFDADSRWALAWFEQLGFDEGEFGVAETLSKAKNTSVEGMVQAGILESARGKVRLLRPEELPADWSPETDERLTNW